MGKVNAAMTTALLIHHFNPKEVIFTGISGGLNPVLLPGDVVIGAKTAQHDLIYLKPDSFEQFVVRNPANKENNPKFFAADGRLLALAEKVKSTIKLKKIATNKSQRTPQIITGVIVTGDTFCGSPAKNAELHNYFKADAVEMEGAAVAQVCYQQNVPCMVIRSLSDSANEKIEHDIVKYLKIAANNAARFTIDVIKLMPKSNISEVHKKSHENKNQHNEVKAK
jgi:adenosylhomocysteine nucleosidase